MNKISRRDFLKGLMAMAGSAALVSLPETAWAAIDVAFEEDTIDIKKPYGRLGSVRLREQWYALEDVVISRRKISSEAIFAPHPDKINKWVTVQPPLLQNISWQVDLYMDFDRGNFNSIVMNDEGGEIEFEIDGRYASFSGKGVLTEYSTAYEIDQVLLMARLEGIGKLERL